MKKKDKVINTVIKNRKASHDYEFLETEVAGISLVGSEVKSIRAGKASIGEAHCAIQDGECFIIGMYVAENESSGRNGHTEPYRRRKLLLTRKQINKWDKSLKTKGLTIVPVKLFISKGKIKINIALSKGKKDYEKRNKILQKQTDRETKNEINKFG